MPHVQIVAARCPNAGIEAEATTLANSDGARAQSVAPDAVRLERLFGAAGDWPPVPVRFRYLVLSNPRTGSSMLCSVLSESGLAGRPAEFLNPRNIDAFMHVRGATNLGDMLRDYQSRRTSPNGYFGMKLHAHQFKRLFKAQVAQDGPPFLRSFNRFVFCTRRDKLNQAISHLLATERDVWQSTPTGDSSLPQRQFVPDDVDKIARYMQIADRSELYWRQTIAALNLPTVEVVLEDLLERGRAEYARVFAHLGINIPEGDVPAPATKPMPRQANEALRQGYLNAIGARAAEIA
jgi:LPS sulfotransferase NodH